MSSLHTDRYPSTWIKIWVGIGMLFFISMTMLSTVANRFVEKETLRLQACIDRKTQECDPSFVWILHGWDVDSMRAAISSVNPSATTSTQMIEDDRSQRTSEKAPRILSVKPEGMIFENGIYRAKVGTKVTVKADAIGAKSMRLEFYPNEVMVNKLAIFKLISGQTYQASFTMTSHMSGELRVLAFGEGDEKAFVALPVATMK